MLRFGGTLTLNSLVVQVAYNTDKILLGRFWGAEALGLYSRAFQLVNIPVDGFGTAVSQVALPALAKVQDDPDRQRSNFLRGFGLFVTLMVPITVASAIFSQDIVRVFLGAKWMEAVPVFTRLTPIMLVLAIINPLSWLMLSTGRTMRSLLIALVIAPVAIAGYSLGLPWGPIGVATGFSSAMLLLAVPVVIWACSGTTLSLGDIAREARPVFISAAVAAAVAYASTHYTQVITPPLLRLTVNSTILFAVYAAGLFVTLEDKSVYWKVLSDANLVRARTKSTS